MISCPGRSAARRLFAAWCAAEPGPSRTPVLGTVPALRSGMKNAAPRPGHETYRDGLPARCGLIISTIFSAEVPGGKKPRYLPSRSIR